MKKLLKITFAILILLFLIGGFLEYKSGFFSLLGARMLYSLGDYKDSENIIKSTSKRIWDKKALAYADFLLGNTRYRQDNLSGAVDAYSDSLRLYEDEKALENRAFVLEKLKEKEPKKNQEEGKWNQNPDTSEKNKIPSATSSGQTLSGTIEPKQGTGIKTPEMTGSGKTIWKTGSGSETNSGKTSSGITDSGAVSGKFMQGKFFRRQWDISDEDLQRALESIRSTDSQKGKYLQNGSSNAEEDSLLGDLKNFLDDSDKKSLGGDSEEKQDW